MKYNSYFNFTEALMWLEEDRWSFESTFNDIIEVEGYIVSFCEGYLTTNAMFNCTAEFSLPHQSEIDWGSAIFK